MFTEPNVQMNPPYADNDQLRDEIANKLIGGGCDSSHYPEALELADEIIDLVIENK